jgi:F-type H+-transporting ATPase subunit gamma
MPSLKAIRKRISSVKSTQKITRAQKMIAGARLARAQARIVALRPYAKKVQELLGALAGARAAESADVAESPGEPRNRSDERLADEAGATHPFLALRPERKVALVLLTSDRGSCGAFNTNLAKMAERTWKSRAEAGESVDIYTLGRKGRDYLNRRSAPVVHDFAHVWDKLDLEKARLVARTVVPSLVRGEVDSIYLIYSQFKSAMSQRVVIEPLLPVGRPAPSLALAATEHEASATPAAGGEPDYIFEPDKGTLLDRLVPMYVETAIYRAMLESMASELGARMTAMDSATKNAKDIIAALTLEYNRARQAAITKELMEIIGGAEALKE